MIGSGGAAGSKSFEEISALEIVQFNEQNLKNIAALTQLSSFDNNLKPKTP